MADGLIRGKSVASIARDVGEGFVAMTPLLLKKMGPEAVKSLYQEIRKYQTSVRGESFPTHDLNGIRKRNLKLQRIHNALIVMQHNAKERKIILA